MLKRLNEALKLIDMILHDFILSRVDLCVNYIMTPAVVEAYIKLGRKSYLSCNVQEKRFTDTVDNNHSLTLVCPSFEIEIYDKEYEISKRSHDYKLSEDYGRVLRLEVRLPRDTIYKYVCQWNLHGLKGILSYFICDSRDIMGNCFERSFWHGDYVTPETAKRLIASQSFKCKTKELMFYILNGKKHIDERFNDLAFDYSCSLKQISRLKNKFEKCGICPATIPVRISHQCGEFLAGMVELFGR